MARSKLVHKLFLGFLVGIVLGFIAFFAVNNFVTATNATAINSQLYAKSLKLAMNITTLDMPIVLPYDPPWAYSLAAFGFGFVVPVAGIISLDMDERQSETTSQTAQPSIIDIGPNLAEALPDLMQILAELKAQGQKKTDEGPPK